MKKKLDKILGEVREDDTPPDASETGKGSVQLATTAETQAGTETEKAVTPAGLAAVVGDINGLLDSLNGEVI